MATPSKRSTTTVVVPCYDEAERLDTSAFRAFLQEFDQTSILFVDDGSSDGTRDILQELCQSDRSRMSLLALPVNCGKAEAVRRGVLRACVLKTDYIGYLDADLATPLPVMMQFQDVLDRCHGVELVLGTRHSLSGHDIDRTWVRRLLSRVFATVAAAAVRVRVHDTQCGAKLFRRGSLLNAVFASPFESRWIFDVEVLARVRAVLPFHSESSLRQAIYELPLDHWREQPGSKLKVSDYFRAISELSSIFAQYTLWRSADWQAAAGVSERKDAAGDVIPFLPRGETLESREADPQRSAA